MADFLLDKGYPVLSTYNSSSTNGVTRYRVVLWDNTAKAIDLCASAASTTLVLGVVQEDVDATKVATGKVVANVRIQGVTWVYVASSGTAPTIGQRVMAGTGGGVVVAATAGNRVLGICVGATTNSQTITNGDLIGVQLTPGAQF